MSIARTLLLLLAFFEVWVSGWLAAEGDWTKALVEVMAAGSALFVCAYLPETLDALAKVVRWDRPS